MTEYRIPNTDLRNLSSSPYLLLTAAPLFWAGNIVLARGVTDITPPVALAFFRWLLALLIVLPFAFRPMRDNLSTLRDNLPIIILISFLGVTCFNTLLYTAVQTTTAINGSLMQTAMPSFVILISFLLFRERLTTIQLIGFLICTLGTITVVVRGNFAALLTLDLVLGDVLILFAVSLYALYSVLVRRAPKMPPLAFIGYTFAIGVALLTPIYFWERSTGAMMPFNGQTAQILLYVAIGPSILAYLCWNSGIQQIGASRGGLFINFLPLFAALLSILFLGEQLQLFHIVGFILILSGMLLFNRPNP